jgi:hypothetical protein
MNIEIPMSNGIGLRITSETKLGEGYPTARIQKGLILLCDGQNLIEEAVGFGVPILKRGLQTIFPSIVELSLVEGSSPSRVNARYKMNLLEKIARSDGGIIQNPQVNAGKNLMAALIRSLPFMRGLLIRTSNLLRSTLGWETTYEPTNSFIEVTLTYTIDASTGSILVELVEQEDNPDGISEIILMNEQGAHYFDQYQDSDGIREIGYQIGIWDQVMASSATLASSSLQLSFSLSQANGARLYRGRELIGRRLAWSGFGYSFPPSLKHFRYEITIKRIS